MRIDAIEGISNTYEKLGVNNKIEGRKDFSEVLELALGDAKQSELDSKLSTAELLAGESSALHDVMIKAEKSELTLNFVMQVRNKMIEAYDQVMKMQV